MISRLPGEILEKKYFIFSSYSPLQIYPLKSCKQDILKIIIDMSFKFGQLFRMSGIARSFKQKMTLALKRTPSLWTRKWLGTQCFINTFSSSFSAYMNRIFFLFSEMTLQKQMRQVSSSKQ